MSAPRLSPDEEHLLEAWSEEKRVQFARGFETGLAYFNTVMGWVVGSVKPLPKKMLERCILQEADRVIRDAPPGANLPDMRKRVKFYAEIHKKRTGKGHME